ncbi:MAG TPA: hypothetical protein VHP62_13175 [Usitatibacter sp.]|jgi:hypothetical protein|nr:hypothetical protein [Usitatibacter sp.]
MSASICHVVELALTPADFPDRNSWAALFTRLPQLGTLKCVEFAIAPGGGGHLSFVVHDAESNAALRDELRALVGTGAIMLCTPRPA